MVNVNVTTFFAAQSQKPDKYTPDIFLTVVNLYASFFMSPMKNCNEIIFLNSI